MRGSLHNSGHTVNTFTVVHGAISGQSVVTPHATSVAVTAERLELKADALLKHNIDELLRTRHQKRVELSRYCRRSRSWLDKIFSEGRREIPLKYLDRIADFFGIATYQLFQPGISPLTERRSGHDRRGLRDRRLSRAVVSEKRGDIDWVNIIRALDDQDRADVLEIAQAKLNASIDALRRPLRGAPTRDAPDRTAESTPATGAPQKRRPHAR